MKEKRDDFYKRLFLEIFTTLLCKKKELRERSYDFNAKSL
jgi:hypothetical protein